MLLNAYSTLLAPPALTFPHTLVNTRGPTDPDLTPHLEGFVGYVLNTREEMTYTLYSVMRHIQRVQVQFSFEVDATELARVSAWAQQANALLFWTDGTVRDPEGRVLVSPDPSALDEAARIPYPADALARKARTEARLETLGVRVPPTLPPVPGEGEVVWRQSAEVGVRVRGLAAVAIVGGVRGEGEDLSAEALMAELPGYIFCLTPEERAFLDEREATAPQIAKFSWRYESLHLLHWALGLTDDLGFPDAICDVPAVIGAARAAAGRDWHEVSPLRPAPVLLDALDLHFRLHWAVRDARLNDRAAPGGLVPGVVLERHYALNWLTHFENSPWDEVDTPT